MFSCHGGVCFHQVQLYSRLDGLLTVYLLLLKGMCVEVKESQINAVSSVSGCGLAFLFLAIEAMSDGGVRVGLPRALSTDLVTQAFIGAARLVQETGKHPGQVGQCMNTPIIMGVAHPRFRKTKTFFINLLFARYIVLESEV